MPQTKKILHVFTDNAQCTLPTGSKPLVCYTHTSGNKLKTERLLETIQALIVSEVYVFD